MTDMRTIWTPKKRKKFLDALRKCANVTHAARLVGCSRQAVYDARDNDPQFAEAWDNAVEEAIDAMEAEAERRACRGYLKPVFQNGKRVGHVREYSDTLLIFMLKAQRPRRFRDYSHIDHNVNIKTFSDLVRLASKEDAAPAEEDPHE
jgi:hypothetical protein